MLTRSLRALAITLPLLLATSCGAAHMKKGDASAKSGDWERALAEYKEAAESGRKTNAVLDKIAKAEKEVAAIYVKRGLEAKSAGKIGEAGSWWTRAMELRPNDKKAGSAFATITEHAVELERFADDSTAGKRFEDAFGAYGALLLVFKERLDLVGKSETAHKAFATELAASADGLAKRGLSGAALVTDLRALRHDPLHPVAYNRSTELRRAMRSRTRVAVERVTMDDRGWWGLGNALTASLSSRLGEHQPYGPTKDKNAIPAVYAVTIEDFAWFDTTTHGVEPRTDGAKKSESKEQVPNPAKAAQKKVVATLEKELAAMEKQVTAAAAAAKTAPRPATADDIAKKKTDLEAARATLASLPDTIEKSAADASWSLPWTETTRTVEARVRFELREPDFNEPVFVVHTMKVEAKDRGHAGNTERGVAADKLEIPAVERLVADLAEKLTPQGIDVMRTARARRVERMLAQGKAAQSAGQEDEALDAYVAALFLSAGQENMEGDAQKLIVARSENAPIKQIISE